MLKLRLFANFFSLHQFLFVNTVLIFIQHFYLQEIVPPAPSPPPPHMCGVVCLLLPLHPHLLLHGHPPPGRRLPGPLFAYALTFKLWYTASQALWTIQMCNSLKLKQFHCLPPEKEEEKRKIIVLVLRHILIIFI